MRRIQLFAALACTGVLACSDQQPLQSDSRPDQMLQLDEVSDDRFITVEGGTSPAERRFGGSLIPLDVSVNGRATTVGVGRLPYTSDATARPIAVTFKDGVVQFTRADGASETLDLAAIKAVEPSRPLPPELAGRLRQLQNVGSATVSQRQSGDAAPQMRSGVVTRRPVSEGVAELRLAREGAESVRQLDATRTELVHVRGSGRTRIIFDMSVGAPTEMEATRPDGTRSLIKSSYRVKDGIAQLVSRETRVRLNGVERVFRESFDGRAAGGMR